jgi:hypothetical protein
VPNQKPNGRLSAVQTTRVRAQRLRQVLDASSKSSRRLTASIMATSSPSWVPFPPGKWSGNG